MIFITAKFQVRPEDAERWPEIAAEFTKATRGEPGCLWFDWRARGARVELTAQDWQILRPCYSRHAVRGARVPLPGCWTATTDSQKVPTAMTYVIALPCVDLLDKTCIDECPVDCIYEGDRMLYIHPDECVDCGACEPVCPVQAISIEADVPAQWKGFYSVNVEFFENLGSPGGASRTGRIGRDHPVVAALPPQR